MRNPSGAAGTGPDCRTLLAALDAGPGDVVCFVGGGGKTTLGLRLVAEAAAAGLSAIFTTTTHIYPPDLPVVAWVRGASPPPGPATKPGTARPVDPVCVAGGPAEGGKLAGLSPAAVCQLTQLADLVVVEADGARGLPLKFPLTHEPVIPACATIVVPVAGASVLGRPLDGASVHRPVAAAAFLGVPVGTAVTPAMVAAILWHPDGATRGRPAGARVIPVINQSDSPERLAGGQAVAAALSTAGAPLILITAAQAASPTVIIATHQPVLPI